MRGRYAVPGLIFLFLCLALPSFAKDKVYTNADLKPGPSLERNSKIDPATGKEIKDEKAKARPKSLVTQARERAETLIHEVRTNRMALAAVIGFIFLLWLACLLDILRFEFRGNNKLIWFIAVTFIPVSGCILYLFIGRRQKKYRYIRDYE
jgi:hypothetical protein